MSCRYRLYLFYAAGLCDGKWVLVSYEQDTLLRVAKLEIRKKIASSREMALNAAQKAMLYGNFRVIGRITGDSILLYM